MSLWKCTNQSIAHEEAKKSLDAVKSACFKCETHSSDCSIAKTAGEINAAMEE